MVISLFYMYVYVLDQFFDGNSMAVHCVIKLTIFSNLFVLYVCICIMHHFWCKFSHNSDFVIQRPYFANVWYGCQQTSSFSVNSVLTVIMSSEDYILKIYDRVIVRHHFSMQIQLWQWLCHLKTILSLGKHKVQSQ